MSEWTGYRGGARRTAALPEARGVRDADGDAEAWRVDLAGAEVLPNGVRVADGRVYVARTDGLSVLDATSGDQVWRHAGDAPGHGLAVCTAQDGRVVLGSADGLVLLSASDGDEWSRIECDLRGDIEFGGALCHLDGTEGVWAVVGDGLRGYPLFADAMDYGVRDDLADEYVEPPLAAGENGLYATTGLLLPDTLVRLEAMRTVGASRQFQWDLAGPAVVGDEALHVRMFEGDSTLVHVPSGIAWLDPEDLSYRRERDSGSGDGPRRNPDAPPAVADGRRYYTNQRGEQLLSVAPDGRSRFAVDLPGAGNRHGIVGPAVVGSVCYVALADRLLGYDDGGDRVFDRRFDDPVVALAGADPGLYVGTERTVHALTDVNRTRVFAGATDGPAHCADCGADLRDREAAFCPACGASLS